MATSSTDNLNSKDDDNAKYECNICFETAKDAVISMCGHLFCWPCIHRWMETRAANSTSCPVCKSAIDKDRLIPIYGRGPGEQKDPRDTVPPRPQGQREDGHNTEQETGFFNPFDMGGGGGGLNISFGMGAFPLFGFGPTLAFQTGPQQFRRGTQAGGRGNPQDSQRQRMARLMLTLALLFIIMIIVS